jgi:hypothetical protein
MRAFGLNYDTGLTVDGRSTRSIFGLDDVRRDLTALATELHATAVRVSGEDPERLEAAGRIALEAGLELWLSPMTYDDDPGALIEHLVAAAAIAERLRAHGEVVAVLGGELSLFARGFVPGDGLAGRIATLTDPVTWQSPDRVAELAVGMERARQTQRSIAARARSAFCGRITYAAGLWEHVEWDLFDIVSVDAYRDATNAATFPDIVGSHRRFGRPVAVTEFGCCTYTGASARGGSGWQIVDWSGPPQLNGGYERNEGEQVRYFGDLMQIFDTVGVDTAFWFTFAGFALPHRADPALDLDRSSDGAVAVEADGWRPKQVYRAIAAEFGRRTT